MIPVNRIQKICQTEDIPPQDARSFDLPMGTVIVAQKDGMFYAYLNRCPHLGIDLELLDQQFMDQDQEFLMCANHGALFEVESGLCVFGPCLQESLEKVAIEVHSDGGIYLVAS